MTDFLVTALGGAVAGLLGAAGWGYWYRFIGTRRTRAAVLVDLATTIYAYNECLPAIRSALDLAQSAPQSTQAAISTLGRMFSAVVIDTPHIPMERLAESLPEDDASYAVRAYDRQRRFAVHASLYTTAFNHILGAPDTSVGHVRRGSGGQSPPSLRRARLMRGPGEWNP
jgi:hypothetical protein